MSQETPHGVYHVRFLGEGHDPTTGGMYATSEGPQQQVVLEPQTPPFMERQDWGVIPILGDQGTKGGVHIMEIRRGGGPGIETFWHYSEDREMIPIVLDQPSAFELESAGKEGMYHIRVPCNRVGVDLYVAAEGRKLFITGIPVIKDPPPRPVWYLRRVGDLGI